MGIVVSRKYHQVESSNKVIKLSTFTKYHTNQLIFGSIVPLSFASLIYLLFRSKTLIVFDLLEKLKLLNFIENLRSQPIISKIRLPDLILYALPDGLYVFSFTTILLLLWGNKLSNKSCFWMFSIPIMAIISEFLQYYGWFPGTYDIADLVCYVVGFILPFYLFRNKLSYKEYVLNHRLISIVSILIYLFLALIAGDITLLQFKFPI